MNEIDLTLENLLLHSYGCNLCKEKAIELFYDTDFDENESFKFYSNIFCKKCIASKIALKYEEYNDEINNWRKNIKLKQSEEF